MAILILPKTPDSIDDDDWQDIPGHKGYQASTSGSIRSLTRIVANTNPTPNTWKTKTIKGRILKASPSNGYLTVKVAGDKSKGVHVLVALAFYGLPDDPKMEVNHKDGNKKNNEYTNLEWVTKSKNAKHSYKVLGRQANKPWLGKFGKDNPKSLPIVAKSLATGEITFYDSAKDAERNGFNGPAISGCCYGKRKSHKGYSWEFTST